MTDDPKWFQPAYRIPDPKTTPGELLFEFVRPSDRAPLSCELRFHGESYGWEAPLRTMKAGSVRASPSRSTAFL
jgi:hypothetical protein